MNDLYYVPKISEFHIGFEYEEYLHAPNWSKLISPPKDLYEWVNKEFNTSTSLSKIISKIERKLIRVKHLDREDIESLGLIFIQDSHINSYEGYRREYRITKTDYLLDYHPNTKRIYISNGESYEDHVTKFDGFIKNKSELKVLLKQLNITNE